MAAMYANVVEMQEAACRGFASRPLFGTKQDGAYRWITYAEFGRSVDEARAGLASLGIGAGDRVAVIANNCVEWAVAAYATYGLGAQFVPMYEVQSPDDRRYILRDSAARVLFARDRSVVEQVKDLPQEIESLERVVVLQGEAPGAVSLAALRASGRRHPVPSVKPNGHAPMGFTYTSGTTGAPKGVILTHANLMAELESLDELVGLTETDRSLSFLPWGHLMGQIEEVHFVLSKGLSTAIVPDMHKILDDFSLVRPTLFFTVPKIFHKLHESVHTRMRRQGGVARLLFERGCASATRAARGESLSVSEQLALTLARHFVFPRIGRLFGGRLRLAVCGGAPLSPEVAQFLDHLGVIVLEGYGLTETTMAIAVNTPRNRRIGSVGRPVRGARVVLDETVDGAGPGEGEIIVYGPHVTPGYHGLPDEFAACLTPDGGLRSGDLGRFDADGFLYVTGRCKEIYKLENGKYVAPAPLEERMRESRYVDHAMLYGEGRPYNVAIVVPDRAEARELARAVGIDPDREGWLEREPVRGPIEADIETRTRGLRSYERPRRLLLVEEEWTPANGLLTPTLKVRRRNVTQKYLPRVEQLYAR